MLAFEHVLAVIFVRQELQKPRF